MFILLENPATKSPAAKVKLKRKAVIIYLITLGVSWNSDLLIMNPPIKSKNPTPIQMLADIVWFKSQVRFLYPSVKIGIILFVAKVPPRIPPRSMITKANRDRMFLFPISLYPCACISPCITLAPNPTSSPERAKP